MKIYKMLKNKKIRTEYPEFGEPQHYQDCYIKTQWGKVQLLSGERDKTRIYYLCCVYKHRENTQELFVKNSLIDDRDLAEIGENYQNLCAFKLK